jgi:signal transduction histidine kinase
VSLQVEVVISGAVPLVVEFPETAVLQVNVFVFCKSCFFILFFSQIVSNFVANGIKFSDDLSRNVVVCVQMETAGQLLITATDDVVGVRPEFESSLFNIYARDERTSVVPGTGLGLSICRKLVANIERGSVGYKPREMV